jgi:hypothetical protein
MGVVILGRPAIRSVFGVGFDDTNVAAGVTNQAMSGLGGSSEGDLIPFAFSIIGISVRGNADCTAGSATFEAMLDGVATGLTAVIDTTNPRQKATTQRTGVNAVTAGGRVHCRYTTTAGFLPAGSTEYEVFIFVAINMAGIV